MNGREYNGSYEHSLSFNQVCAVLAVPAAAMVPISAWCVQEAHVGARTVTLRQCAPPPPPLALPTGCRQRDR